jgi:hypothetical protein
MKIQHVDISLDLEPFSKNHNPTRSHWPTKASAKKTWEKILIEKFYEAQLPRPIPQTYPHIVPIEVFVVHRRRRRIKEPENWRGFLAEVIGDALIGRHTGRKEKARHDGWIYDDTKDYWRFHFDVSDTYGSILTMIRIMWMEGRVQVPDNGKPNYELISKLEREVLDDDLSEEEKPVKGHMRHITKGPIFDANPYQRVDDPEHGECVIVEVPEHKRTVRTKDKTNTREEDTHEESDQQVA